MDVPMKEGRFAPYFFPNECVSDEAGTTALRAYWNSEKRAMLRKPLDRIGFGGYLKLVDGYPAFVKEVAKVCDEFREIRKNVTPKGSYTKLKVAILSYWGKQDSWMFGHTFIDDYGQKEQAYLFLLNALSGQPVDVSFIRFEELMANDLSDYDAIVNLGSAATSLQGDYYWSNPNVVTKMREYVSNGGGFVGIGEPTAYHYQGKYFQLSDVLGAEREMNETFNQRRLFPKIEKNHWITSDINLSKLDFSRSVRDVYPISATPLLAHFDKEYPACCLNSGHLDLAINQYGKGRSAYLSGALDSYEAYRLIYKILLWASHKEAILNQAFSSDVRTDAYYYPENKRYALLNNSGDSLVTDFYDIDGGKTSYSLKPHEMLWIN